MLRFLGDIASFAGKIHSCAGEITINHYVRWVVSLVLQGFAGEHRSWPGGWCGWGHSQRHALGPTALLELRAGRANRQGEGSQRWGLGRDVMGNLHGNLMNIP